MIKDDRAFQEEFVPSEIVHRNSESNEIYRALEPLEHGQSAEKVTFLFGPSGTGKTCIARHLVRQLDRELPEADTKYVNCWHSYSRFGILRDVLEGISSTSGIHRQSTPTDELLRQVKQYEGEGYVVVLDEVDQIDDHRVLYDLYGIPSLSFVLIANVEEELFAQLDDRLVSRFQTGRRVHFDKYGINELADILGQRARVGLRDGSIGRRQLELIADLAAGDARIAIRLLGSSARRAKSEGLDEITGSVVRDMVPKAHKQRRDEVREKLRDHQEVLYDILEQHEELEPGELYRLYQERVDEPKTNRTVRNYLQKMVHYDLVVAEGEKRARTYHIKDGESQ